MTYQTVTQTRWTIPDATKPTNIARITKVNEMVTKERKFV